MTRLLKEPYVTVSRHTAPSPDVVFGLFMFDRIAAFTVSADRLTTKVSEAAVCDRPSDLCAVVAVRPPTASQTNKESKMILFDNGPTTQKIAVCWLCTI